MEGNSYQLIRTMYSNQGSTNLVNGYNPVLRSAWNVMAVQFISTPIVYASLPILMVSIYTGDKHRWLIRLTAIMAVLWMLTSGGRSIIVWMGIYFVFLLIYYKKKIKLSKKIKRTLFIVGIAAFVLAIYITLSRRSGTDLILLKQLYVYFPVALKNFDIHVNEIINNNTGNFYGLASFYGFIYPIIFFAHQLFGLEYPQALLDARYYSFTVLEKDVSVGQGIYMNAYATIFYQPFLDGGYIGVFVILFFWGGLCKYFYFKVVESGRPRDLVIYLFLIQKILFSHVRFYFTQTQQAIALLIILFIYSNHHRLKFKLKKL